MSAGKQVRPAAQADERHQYRNPPIAEATCEFQFAHTEEWNLAHTAQFLARVSRQYSGKPREQRLFQVDSGRTKGAAGDGTSASVREITRIQVPTLDGSKLVGTGAGRLSVHVTKPYRGWEDFRQQISDALDVYLEIGQPTGIRRIGIRYVNLIEPEGNERDPKQYFAAPGLALGRLNVELDTFAQRYEYIFTDEPIKALVNMARVESVGSPATPSFLLDIDVVREWTAAALPVKRALPVIDDMRRRERDVFEALITDRSRAMFDA